VLRNWSRSCTTRTWACAAPTGARAIWRAGSQSGIVRRSLPRLTLTAFDNASGREAAFGRAAKELRADEWFERELRRVVAERDAAYSNAVAAVVEEIDGRAVVVDRPNPDDLDRADEIFEASMRGLLDDTQRKRWEKREMSTWFAEPRPTEKRRTPVPALRQLSGANFNLPTRRIALAKSAGAD
jgi:hypothetical protein